jgi:hypothetical protein
MRTGDRRDVSIDENRGHRTADRRDVSMEAKNKVSENITSVPGSGRSNDRRKNREPTRVGGLSRGENRSRPMRGRPRTHFLAGESRRARRGASSENTLNRLELKSF